MWFVLYRIYKNSSEKEWNLASARICGDTDPSHDYWAAIKFFPSEEESLSFIMKEIFKYIDNIDFEINREVENANPSFIAFANDYCNMRNWHEMPFENQMKLWIDYQNLWSEEYIGIQYGECKVE